jgi:uncharacterized damage-inducible protein DinB
MRIILRYGLLALAALTAAALVPIDASAQSGAAQPARGSARPVVIDALLRDLAMAEQKLMALAEAIPEDKYGWRPAEGVRSVGEVLMHIAADNYFLPTAAGTAAPASTGIMPNDYPSVQAYEQRSATKAEAMRAMRESFVHLRSSMERTPDAFLAQQLKIFGMELSGLDLWVLTTTHLHEHLGQLIAYARSNAVAPPWSQ